ncbi:MAG: hypothetical protein NT062_06940 [Proteobacteria bacterium]|nr:hypothetical protein [Pseudomonadota bacterium]
MNDDKIHMRLLDVERCYYDPHADFLVAVALDEASCARAEEINMRKAEKIYKSARAYTPRSMGAVNVRENVIDVLRRIGGAR